MLILKNITKVYHNKNGDVLALDDISLAFENKGMTFILGPSGCGKTTLLNIVSGNDSQYEGERQADGSIECMPQEIQLFENMSILDNLLLVSEDKEKII